MTLMIVMTGSHERCAAILKHKKIIIGDDPPEVSEQSERNVRSKVCEYFCTLRFEITELAT